MSLELGDRLGEYEIRGFLGSGGMGTVFRAWQPVLRRDVALKVIRDDQTGTFVQRFDREVEISVGLSHPNLVKIYDAGNTGTHAYLVMELLEGRTLAEVIQREGVMSCAQALSVGRDIADALTYLHDHEVIHRDVKPANVMIDPEGRVKLMDLGLAHAEGHTMLTRDDHVVGTVRYLPPEALRGPVRDGRADVYALGVLLFEMLTGKHPLVGSDLQHLLDELEHAPAPLLRTFVPGVPPGLEALVDRMLKKALADRPTATEALAELEELADTIPETRPGERPGPGPGLETGRGAVLDPGGGGDAVTELMPVPPSVDARTGRRAAVAVGFVIAATALVSLAFLVARSSLVAPAAAPQVTWAGSGPLDLLGKPAIVFSTDHEFRPVVRILRGGAAVRLDAEPAEGAGTSHRFTVEPSVLLEACVIEVTDGAGREIARIEEEGLLVRLGREHARVFGPDPRRGVAAEVRPAAGEAVPGPEGASAGAARSATRPASGGSRPRPPALVMLQAVARAARWSRPMNHLVPVLRGDDRESARATLESLAPPAAAWYRALGRLPACVLDARGAPDGGRRQALELLEPPRVLDRLLALHGLESLRLGAEQDLGDRFATAAALEACPAPDFEIRREVRATLVPTRVAQALGDLALIEVARQSEPLVAGKASPRLALELEGAPPDGFRNRAARLEVVACNSLAQSEAIAPQALLWACLTPELRLLLHGGGGVELPHEAHRDFRLIAFFDPVMLPESGPIRLDLELEPLEAGDRGTVDVFVREVALSTWKEPR